MAIDKERQEVTKWHARINTSKLFKDEVAAHWQWHHNVAKYEGNFHELQEHLDIDIPPIQLVFAYIKTELPRLYLRDPHIKINAKKASSIQSAKILEQAINYIWRTKKLKHQIKKSIIDGKLVGHAWTKTGYTGEFGAIEDHEGNVQEFVESEDFFGYRVSWQNIDFDLDSVNPPHDTAWISHEFFIPLEDLKKDKSFTNVNTIQGVGPKPRHSRHSGHTTTRSTSGGSGVSSLHTTGTSLESDVPMARLFEIWDNRKRKVFTIAEGSDRYIKKPIDWPYDLKGFPFSYMRFHEPVEGAYGIPDVTMLMPQFLEKIKIRAAQLDHIKRYNRQYNAKRNTLDAEAKKQLSDAITGAVIESENGPGDIAPIPYPPLPQDAYAVEARIDGDITIVGGQSPLELGAPAKTQTRTIREAIEQQQGSENRRSEQIDVVEDYVEDISQNLIGLLQQFADEPFYVSITGEDPKSISEALQGRPSQQASPQESITTDAGFTFTKEDIQGEFDIDIVSGSTVPLTKAAILEILTQLMPFMQQLGAIPGGPLAGTVGRMFGDLLDLPEIKIAIEQEGRLQKQLQEQQQQQQQELAQNQAVNDAAQVQIQSERISTAQQKNILTAGADAASIQQKERDSIRKNENKGKEE